MMLWVNWSIVGYKKQVCYGVKIKASGDSKLKDSPDYTHAHV